LHNNDLDKLANRTSNNQDHRRGAHRSSTRDGQPIIKQIGNEAVTPQRVVLVETLFYPQDIANDPNLSKQKLQNDQIY